MIFSQLQIRDSLRQCTSLSIITITLNPKFESEGCLRYTGAGHAH